MATEITFDTPLILTCVGVFILLLLSAFFSGSETALIATSRVRIHQLAKKGNKRASTVEKLRDNNEDLIGGILIGNNIANITASVLATSVLIAIFGEAGIAYATVGMTVLVVIFAEVMPKTFAINKSNRTALAVAPIIRFVVVMLLPFSRAASWLGRGVLSLFGIDTTRNLADDEDEEELRGMIDMHDGPGDEETQERLMLRSILDLADVEVSEIMTHRGTVGMIDLDASVAEVLSEVMASPFTRIPLWKDNQDNIVGVLHAKALLRAIRNNPAADLEELDIKEISNDPWFIPETTSLLDQLQAFKARREHFAIVVDEYGSLMGIVTLEDILEEIVGDITDEHDIAVAGVRPQPDGSYIVEGTVTIRDLNREFDWDLPDEEASTIAGLVLHEARLIPNVGQDFDFFRTRFRILRRHKNQITSLKLTRLPSEIKESA